MKYALRVVRLIFGLFLFAMGSVLIVQANIGLAPWEAFSSGVSMLAGISFGTVVIITGVVVLVFDLLLHEKIGLGTICDTLLIGTFIDWIQSLKLIPMLDNMPLGICMLLFGQFVICIGGFFYMGSAFGCGPRDAFVVGVSKRLKRVPFGVVRSSVDGCVLLIGFLLGAKVGWGTLIAVVSLGVITQLTFYRMLKFDPKAIQHENIIETCQHLWHVLRKRPTPATADAGATEAENKSA